MRPAASHGKLLRWMIPSILIGAGLRIAGISWGLPQVFNADEPHLVNLALSFGRGSLSPYLFKYPTLWPYLLFFCYGLYFLIWSGFGALHGVRDFVGLYAWHPTGFYFIGRIFSTCFSLLGIWAVGKTESELREKPWPWAAMLMALCPVLVELAHSCKPDSLMFFFAGLAWLFALRVYREGARGAHWACGLCLGLAMSSQYTVLPAVALLPLAHLLRRAARPRRWLVEGSFAAAAGFFVGSPYIAIDFPRFWENLRDMSQAYSLETLDRTQMAKNVLANVWNFAAPGSIAGLAACIGLAGLWRKDKRLAIVFAVPVLLYLFILSDTTDGGWPRYLLGVYPGLALLASEGLEWASVSAPLRTGLALAALGPGLYHSAIMDRDFLLPDTRTEATDWVSKNIQPGTALLLDEPHASPDAPMTKEEVVELWAKTRAAGSPRAYLYRGMADSHPGGGYRIYRIKRSAKDLHSSPYHVALSQADGAYLDVRAGLDAAKRMKVEYVVTSTHGTDPRRAPEMKKFFDQLERQGSLIKVFLSSPGRAVGPDLRIYRLGPPRRTLAILPGR